MALEPLVEPVVAPVAVGEPIAAGPWTDGFVSVVVPDAWTAETGPPGTPLVLRTTEPTTDAVVEIWAYALTGRPQVRPRPDCTPLLDDDGRYRAVPALDPAASHSCTQPDGTVVLGWYGARGQREVHVEAVLPPGAAFAGRVAIEGFLRDIELRR